jgi:hypothetical protein
VSVSIPEGYTVAWLLRGMEVIRSMEIDGHDFENVICSITFRLRVINKYSRTVAIDSSIELPINGLDPETYTEFSALSKDQATDWFESQLSEEIRDQMLDRAIATLQNPDYMYFTQVPWYNQDPIDTLVANNR